MSTLPGNCKLKSPSLVELEVCVFKQEASYIISKEYYWTLDGASLIWETSKSAMTRSAFLHKNSRCLVVTWQNKSGVNGGVLEKTVFLGWLKLLVV